MRLINADALKTKVKAMVTHKVNESDYEFGGNQALDYVADITNRPNVEGLTNKYDVFILEEGKR